MKRGAGGGWGWVGVGGGGGGYLILPKREGSIFSHKNGRVGKIGLF